MASSKNKIKFQNQNKTFVEFKKANKRYKVGSSKEKEIKFKMPLGAGGFLPKKKSDEAATDKVRCQKCLNFGHWTYECKGERKYVHRDSRTKTLKRKLQDMKKSDQNDHDDMGSDKKKPNPNSSSSSSSSSSSGSSSDSDSSSSSSSSSSSTSSSSGSSPSPSKKKKKKNKKKHRK